MGVKPHAASIKHVVVDLRPHGAVNTQCSIDENVVPNDKVVAVLGPHVLMPCLNQCVAFEQDMPHLMHLVVIWMRGPSTLMMDKVIPDIDEFRVKHSSRPTSHPDPIVIVGGDFTSHHKIILPRRETDGVLHVVVDFAVLNRNEFTNLTPIPVSMLW